MSFYLQTARILSVSLLGCTPKTLSRPAPRKNLQPAHSGRQKLWLVLQCITTERSTISLGEEKGRDAAGDAGCLPRFSNRTRFHALNALNYTLKRARICKEPPFGPVLRELTAENGAAYPIREKKQACETVKPPDAERIYRFATSTAPVRLATFST